MEKRLREPKVAKYIFCAISNKELSRRLLIVLLLQKSEQTPGGNFLKPTRRE
jgi:hypothetical protein